MFSWPIFRLRRSPGASCALLACILCGCGQTPEKESKAPKAAPTVQVVLVQPQDVPQTIKAQGSLLADEQAVVGVKVAGRVDQVAVDIGARVRQGKPLAVLDLADFKVRIKQARAEEAAVRARLGLKPDEDLEQLDKTKVASVQQEKALLEGARLAYERALGLRKGSAISTEEIQVYHTSFKVAETRYLSALQTVDEQIALLDKHTNARTLAENALADATITAPFDGIVAVRHVAPGVFLQVGDPVVTLVRTNPLRFHGGIPERHSLLVEPGQEALITIEGLTAPLLGKVSRLSPVLNLASRSLPIEIDVPNPDLRLRAGLFAEAEIVVNPRAAVLVVPRSAVVDFAGVEKVCVVEDGQAVLRRVVTGRALGERVEVVEGLRAGEEVAVHGATAPAGPVTAVRVSLPPASAKGSAAGAK
jgi:RND family efflux transporter MFP subunit